MNTTQTIELRCLQNYFHQGYGATKTVGCTLEPFRIPVAGNLPVTGTGEQKRPSVPENVFKIRFPRVQESKNVHLYPKMCSKSVFFGYRNTKTPSCTRQRVKNPFFSGTGEQKRPSVPVWHLKRGLEKFVLGYSVLARDIDMCDSKYDAKCDQKTVPHCDTAEYKLAGGYHG